VDIATCFSNLGMCVGKMSLSDAAVWLQTIIIVFGFFLAIIQFMRWRDAIAYDKKVDLAMRIGDETYHFQEGFKFARYPFGRYRKDTIEPEPGWKDAVSQAFGPGISREEMEDDSKVRLEKIFDPLVKMRLLMWQASVLFEPKLSQQINENFYELEELYKSFGAALFNRNNRMTITGDPDPVATDNILGVLGAKDRKTFERKIDIAIERMRSTVKSVTRGEKIKVNANEDRHTNS
jgi:hypothetical protein